MDLRSLKKDVQSGTATVESLFGMLERMNRRLRRVEAENSRLRQRLGKYEPEVLTGELGDAGDDETEEATVDAQHYSLEAEERRRGELRKKPLRQGRVKTDVKWQQLTEPPVDLFPENVSPEECELGPQRVVWRADNGLAKRVGYQLHRGPHGELPQVPNVLPAGEFDVQIVAMLAYLTYIMRLSLDQVCELFGVFWKLPLIKSQADALLNQLSRELSPEFDRICELLALATVAWTDDTGWKIAGQPSNATVIGNHELTLLMFGCEKGRAALQKILPPDVFRGVLVSDDHATYQLATPMQKSYLSIPPLAVF